MNYDKKRIASTVILFIFLIISIVIVIPFLPLSWETIKQSAEEQNNGWVAIFGAFAIIFCFLFYGVALLISGICLPFAIKNRHSTLKAIRIISYVQDGLFSLVLLTCLLKMILLLLGV